MADDVAIGNPNAQGSVRFRLSKRERIASAGSCFAARLAEHLRSTNTNYFVVEPAPKWLDRDQQLADGYWPFSARYGLVFSAGQLEQLFDRAFRRFVPLEIAWSHGDRFVDPFRPRSPVDGYSSVRELEADREQHLTAVRRMFEETDTFFFTVGLTESWRDRRDGAIYPYCPGTAAGKFDADLHEYHNSSLMETIESLDRFVSSLRAVNPKVRVVFSVSPIPIGATMESQHIVRASTYMKSVLRVAVEEMYQRYDFVEYFASFELVSQSFFGTDPFTQDRRHLKPGVAERVVRAFEASFLADDAMPVRAGESIVIREQLQCDEDIIAR